MIPLSSKMIRVQCIQLKFMVILLTAASLPFIILTLLQTNENTADHTLHEKVDDLVARLLNIEKRFNDFLETYEANISSPSAVSIQSQSLSPVELRTLTNLKPYIKWKSLVSQDINSSKDYSIYLNRNKTHKTRLVSTVKCQYQYELLILVTSHLSNFERRNVIRSTWGSDLQQKKARWKTYFLLGKSEKKEDIHSLASEISAYGDIILTDVNEDFYNLTYKVQMGMEWALKYCEFRFLLKGDDDVFVNMPQLFKFLSSKDTPSVELYAGNVNFAAPVLRTGKYGVSEKEYQKKFYPRYCSGGGLVLSRDLISKFVAHFDDVRYLKIDDAYIGELALKSGIDIHHDENFLMFEDEKKCEYKPKAIVTHPVKNEGCMEYLFKKTIFYQVKMGEFKI